MKRKFLVLLIASALLLTSCGSTSDGQDTLDTSSETEAVTDAETEAKMEFTYYIRSPYNTEETQQGDEYTSLQQAKDAADKLSHFGYVVFDSEGKLAYNPCPSFAAAKILYNAKLDADYMRDNNYIYGDANVNPALDKTEKVVSCDRYVGWVLYDAGFNTKRQPSTKGYALYGTNTIEDLLKRLGFEKITDEDEVQAGDIIFVGNSQNIPVPQDLKDYPKHVFICAGKSNRRNFYRYDAGSNTRIKSTQPSVEPLSSTGAEFRFAYRPTDK